MHTEHPNICKLKKEKEKEKEKEKKKKERIHSKVCSDPATLLLFLLGTFACTTQIDAGGLYPPPIQTNKFEQKKEKDNHTKDEKSE